MFFSVLSHSQRICSIESLEIIFPQKILTVDKIYFMEQENDFFLRRTYIFFWIFKLINTSIKTKENIFTNIIIWRI